jgi:hypothetical protein
MTPLSDGFINPMDLLALSAHVKGCQLAEGLGRNFTAPYSAPVLPLRNQPCKIKLAC